MVGWIVTEQRPGWRVCRSQSVVRGLPLLRAEVPMCRETGERVRRRRVARAARLLYASGCRSTLVCPGFSDWDVLLARGLRPVDTGPLCQALAAPLTLALLAARGVPPAHATVALRGARVGRAFFQAAEALCPAVRRLVITAADGGERLARYLRMEYGVAVVEEGAGGCPDVTVCFSPETGAADSRLSLCPPAPYLAELAIRPRGEALPEALESLPLLELLWEGGSLPLADIEIFSMRRPEIDLTGRDKLHIILK